MFGRQSQAQISDAHEQQHQSRRHDLPPGFAQGENGEQQKRENESAFLAERAEEKQRRSRKVEHPEIGAFFRRNANAAVEAEKAEHRGEWIRAARDVGDSRGVNGMHRPNQRRDEREPAPFAFLDVPAPQKLCREKKQREGCADLKENAAEMITGWLENERSVIREIGQALDRPIEIGRGRVDEKKMLKRFGNELPAADERVAQDEGSIVPDEIVSQRRGVGRENRESEAER